MNKSFSQTIWLGENLYPRDFVTTRIRVKKISRVPESGPEGLRTARKCVHAFSYCENLCTRETVLQVFGSVSTEWGRSALLATRVIQPADMGRIRDSGYAGDTKCMTEKSSFWLRRWYQMQEWERIELFAMRLVPNAGKSRIQALGETFWAQNNAREKHCSRKTSLAKYIARHYLFDALRSTEKCPDQEEGMSPPQCVATKKYPEREVFNRDVFRPESVLHQEFPDRECLTGMCSNTLQTLQHWTGIPQRIAGSQKWPQISLPDCMSILNYLFKCRALRGRYNDWGYGRGDALGQKGAMMSGISKC